MKYVVRKKQKGRKRMVIVNFPSETLLIVTSYDQSVNDDALGLTYILTKVEVWMEMENCKVP